MGIKKQFPLRIERKIFKLIEQWANDEYRSVNGQIEYLLRDALRRAGRLKGEHDESSEKDQDLR